MLHDSIFYASLYFVARLGFEGIGENMYVENDFYVKYLRQWRVEDEKQ